MVLDFGIYKVVRGFAYKSWYKKKLLLFQKKRI